MKTLRINNQEVEGNHFAYDGCHKIYILKTIEEIREASKMGYKIYLIDDLLSIFENSCPLRFIEYWDLSKQFVEQGDLAKFTYIID
jgi:hypothetical protein